MEGTASTQRGISVKVSHSFHLVSARETLTANAWEPCGFPHVSFTVAWMVFL